jgi:hypothetical protein
MKFQYQTDHIPEDSILLVPIARCPLPTVYCSLSIVHCPLFNFHCPLPVHCLLPTSHCPLSVPNAHCLLSTIYCPLFTTHCRLSIAHCPLFTDNCPLPTAHVHCQLTTVHGACCISAASLVLLASNKATAFKELFRFALSGHRFRECGGQWAVILGSGQQTERSKQGVVGGPWAANICQWAVNNGQQ